MPQAYIEQFSIGEGPIKVALKDCFDIQGYRSALGSKAFVNAAPAKSNAAVVDSLLDAGCELTGKLTMHELAFGMTGVNSWMGTPTNPNYPELIPGGSSSGCAAIVAEGAVDFALGTDTGGSIRLPAACCGVYGLKPTFSKVSRIGVQPEQSSLDCVGPLANSIESIITAMQIIDPSFETCDVPAELSQVNAGLVQCDAIDEITSVLNSAVNQSGLCVSQTSLKSLDDAFSAAMSIIGKEAWSAFGSLTGKQLLGADVESRLQKTSAIGPEEIEAAERIRTAFTGEVDELLKKHSLLILPALPHFPMTLVEALSGKTDLLISAYLRPFNLSGHPALTIPLKNELAKPISMQLVAAKGQDAWLCNVAKEIVKQINK